MKTIKKLSMLFACLILSATSFTSCEWDTSGEPDHPLFVSYTITAGAVRFDGPEQLLTDINAWIKANQIVYDVQVNYTTGDASEFTATDAQAITKYNEFAPKFKEYLNDMMKKLGEGAYKDEETGSNTTVATFFISAARTQGQEGSLKYEQVEFNYPKSNGQ